MYYSMAANEGSRTGNDDVGAAGGGPVAGSGRTAEDVEDAEDAEGVEALEAVKRARWIDEIRALEELKSEACAAQARAAAAFDASTRRTQARGGMKKDQLGRGVAGQIALARRESAHNGAKLLGLARILTTEMPHTLHALEAGVISEWRAIILVRETASLSREDRSRVDELIAGDLAGLETLGDAKLVARIKSVSYGLDPHSVVNRAAKAASERFVSCRPAPDTMTYVTGLLPVAQGVGVFAALTREADRLRAAGDARTRGQIMADTLVERVTGQARAEDVRVEVQLIMTDRALLHGILPGQQPRTGQRADSNEGSDGQTGEPLESLVAVGSEPAVLAGYGIVPAQWARDLVRGGNTGNRHAGSSSERQPDGRRTGDRHRPDKHPDSRPDKRTEVWLRRLYTAPDTGRLMAMDSRARLVPAGLARFIAARDLVCRMPWCGAPIRHYDHITPVRDGGPTSAENIQGLCEACNQAKEAPGWKARAVGDRHPLRPPGRHTVETTTPTGHVYRSTAPPIPASHSARQSGVA